jgi:hypothetical protein
MKNVHLLPTDKPSRLGYLTKKGKEVFNNLVLFDMLMPNILDSENQNIYITNDEEIKIDDYYLGEDNNLYCLVTKVNSNGKKIILTTDQELIDEGIQPIDDEFLEWFVKNPSCEKVYTTDEYVQVNQDNPILRGSTNVSHRYEIIIPQEEPKQETLSTKLHIGEVVDESYPEAFRKQETLEEAAKRTYQKGLQDDIDLSFYDGVRLGSKWQAERMYSEEEVLSILNDFIGENPIDVDRWFEQFKKK